MTVERAGTSQVDGGAQDVGRLHLRAVGREREREALSDSTHSDRRVVWTEDTIDNEGMGKKKSKICCIYHKPRAFDESSSESSDSDSDGSSSSAPESSSDDDGAARPSRGMRHRHTHRCKHGRTPDAAGPKANAYERP
ncbi:hypothetical protein CBS9595_003701 [Malassezia furfur]|nr:hypothetical protein CBS9595_003701 [Malassezia furfur]